MRHAAFATVRAPLSHHTPRKEKYTKLRCLKKRINDKRTESNRGTNNLPSLDQNSENDKHVCIPIFQSSRYNFEGRSTYPIPSPVFISDCLLCNQQNQTRDCALSRIAFSQKSDIYNICAQRNLFRSASNIHAKQKENISDKKTPTNEVCQKTYTKKLNNKIVRQRYERNKIDFAEGVRIR